MLRGVSFLPRVMVPLRRVKAAITPRAWSTREISSGLQWGGEWWLGGCDSDRVRDGDWLGWERDGERGDSFGNFIEDKMVGLGAESDIGAKDGKTENACHSCI